MKESSGNSDDGLATVARGAGLVFGGRIAKLLLLFGVQLILARILGSTDYGGVVLATMVAGVAGLFGKAGLPAGLSRKIPYYENDPEVARGVAKAGLQLALLTSVAVAILLLFAAPILSQRVFEDPSITVLLRIGAIGVPFGVLMNVGISTAKGARDATTQVLVRQIFNPIARMVFIGGLVLAGFGAIGAITGSVIAKAMAMLAAVLLAIRALPFSVLGPTVRMHRELLTFSLPLMLASSMNFLISHSDTILIGVFLTFSDVGVYNIAFNLQDIGMFFFYPITFLLPPVLTRLTKHDEWGDARQIYKIASTWLVLLTTPVFLLVFFFPEVVIGVTFGAEYLPGSTALRVLMIPVMVTVLLSANGAALIALGHNRINLYVNTGVAVLNIVLNIILIPMLGIVGAAAASAASFITRDLSYTILLYRWERLQPFSASMLRSYLITLFLAGAGYIAFVNIVQITFISVLAIGVVFLILYAPLLIITGAFDPEDEELLSLLEEQIGMEFELVRSVVTRLQN